MTEEAAAGEEDVLHWVDPADVLAVVAVEELTVAEVAEVAAVEAFYGAVGGDSGDVGLHCPKTRRRERKFDKGLEIF